MTPCFAWAASTINCHCFKDREYDSLRAYAADPYFLATTQNSLMATLFDLNKKDVVSAKMAGADGDNLWVGYYLSKMSGEAVNEINFLYSREKSWSAVVKILKIDPEKLGVPFRKALDDPKMLAEVVVDEQLLKYLNAAVSQVNKLRDHGANNQKTIMAVFLGQLSLQEPVELFKKVEEGKSSWGHLLAGQGLFNGSDVENKWRQLLGTH